ncbi:peptidoglycan DD-metalloendopeptidase family protein [Streptomyces anulatus]|uniref:Peptidoglycan DD-metalloendopeptidase family protein n=1 Tax=Streptomyces anulatus TaxID=1892 RepID=A0ABZ1ZDK4_STRAQ|nr:peptidoglycan DD-metalloendopeptidase family protein [Streptomyces anulatus]
MSDIDIVGGAAVDVVPVIPQFHAKLKTLVLPIADRVGSEAGERMGRAMSLSLSQHLTINIPSAVNQAGQAAQAASRRQGGQNAGSFAGAMRRHLQAAFRSMPHLDISITATGADAELARLRAKLEQLSNRRIGIDVTASAARAEIERIERELERLGAQHPNIRVQADTAAARAALAAMRAEMDAIGRREINVPVDVDTSRAMSALMSLGIQAAALVAIPVGPVLAAGLGAVVSMAAAAGAGFAAVGLAAVPAIKGVTEALTAKSAAEKESANATDNSAQIAGQAASKALQLAGAQATLGAAHRNAATSIAQANRQIEVAERAVADAATRAADQRESAADNVRRAEVSLTDAKRAARQAEDDLTNARKTAAQQLEDLNDRLIDGGLAQRDAALRVKAAQQDLAATMADPKASTLQREQAQLAYDQAVRSAERQKEDFEELQKSAKAQKEAGVEGSDAVKAAQERLSTTQKGVGDATNALRDAQEAQTRAAVDGARAVADAQERVSEATRSAAEAQVSASESIANAERSLSSARLSSSTSTATAATKADEYREALAKLTEPQRQLFDSIAGPSGLKEAFDDWSLSLQPEVLPIFTRMVNGAKEALPGLTPLVLSAADGISTLQDKASEDLKDPFWASFKKGIAEAAEPSIVGLGTTIGNVIKGAAGVVDAFLPHMDGIADRSDGITERFAKWGTSLKGSPEFERFLDYVKETAPGVGEFLGDVLMAAIDVSKAISPLSTSVMSVIGPVFTAVSWLATNTPELIVGLWGIYAAQKAIAIGMAAFAGAMALYQSVILLSTIATAGFGTVLAATGIGPIIRAIVLVVGLLVAGFVLAYKNSETFRTIVDGAWNGVQAAIGFAWNSVIKPAFDGMMAGFKAIGEAAVWLWGYVGPVFGYLYEGAQNLVTGVITLFLVPAYLAFKALGVIATWLWEGAIGPAFVQIGEDASWLWNSVLSPVFTWIGEKAVWLYDKAIKPAFKNSKESFEDLADAGRWLWREVLSPVFGFIGDGAEKLYKEHLKPAFKWMKDGIKAVADSFETANSFIDEAWSKVADIAKEPIKVVIDTVYNGGIVPVWNAVAKITGADDLKPLKLKGFHTGGIMSGYSPGRDDRVIAVGGGEAILRPEVTRALGHDPINTWNSAARSGGVGAVQRAISNGMPAFKDGGIVGWFKNKASDAGNFLSGLTDYIDPTKLFGKASKFITEKMTPVMTNPWARNVAKIPGKLLSSLKDAALNVFGFGGGGSGQWAKPVNAAYGTPFGKKGSMWSSGQHTGLDFPAAVGAAVRAVAGGKVAMAKSGGPYGNHVMINHGGGLTSLYAHLSRMLTSVGDTVKQGQKIGEVGSTGNSSGPHLHLEARVNGKAVDPMSYLTGGGGVGGGGKGVERWRSTVKAALQATGNPLSYADLTLRRMNQESGGNPTAVNNWDINAKNGTPSVGLMQVIKPTFEAYAGMFRKQGPFKHGVSVDPMANIFSSMRYAKAAYGSLPTAYNRPGGYAKGGFPQIGEMAWVGEKGPELLEFLTPTQVHSNRDSMAIARATQSIPARGSVPAVNVNVEARTYLDGREVAGVIDERIDIYDAETGRALETGRIL